MNELPPGFTLETPQTSSAAPPLPPGFTLETNAAPTKSVAEGLQSAFANPPKGPSFIGLAKAAMEAAKLPGDVYAGKIDPLSNEGIGKSFEAATMLSPLSRGATPLARAARPAAAPTEEALQSAITSGYKSAHEMGLEINPTSVAEMAARAKSDLVKTFGVEKPAESTIALLNQEMASRAPLPQRPALDPRPGPPAKPAATVAELDNLRQQFGAIANGAGTQQSERMAAKLAQRHIDNFLSELDQHPGSILKGDAVQAVKVLKEARSNAAALFRHETVQGKIDLGELNAATAHGGQNIDNATRQAIKQLIRPDNKRKTLAEKMGFSKEEIAAMNRVARGSFVGNRLREFGKLAPTDFIKAAIHGDAALKTGGASLLLAIPAYGAKRLGDRSTNRAAQSLSDLVRYRSALGQQMPGMPAQQAGSLSQLSLGRGLLPLSESVLSPLGSLQPMLPLQRQQQ